MFFRFSPILILLFFLLVGCTQLFKSKHERNREKNTKDYTLRNALCHIPMTKTFSGSASGKFVGSIFKATATGYSSTVEPKIHPNIAFSFDQLQTWKYFTIQDNLIFSSLWDESTLYALSLQNFWVSENAGLDWNKIPTPLKNISDRDQIQIFQATDSQSIQIVTGPENSMFSIYSTRDRGQNWNINTISGNNFYHFQSRTDGNIRILTSSTQTNSQLYVSTDLGLTWNLQYDFSTGTGSSFWPSYLWFENENSGIASGGTSVFKTTDGGLNWVEIPQSFPYNYTTILYFNGNNLYGKKSSRRGSGGILSSSTDGGTNWNSWETTIPEIQEVFSEQEIVTTYATYTSFTGSPVKQKLPRFAYDRYGTLWELDWGTCWINLMIVPNPPPAGSRSE